MQSIRVFSILALTVLSQTLNAEIIMIKDRAHFDSLKGTKPMVVDFYAEWCGVCKRVKPMVENLEKKHGKDVLFVMVNAGDAMTFGEKLKTEYSVRGFPSFVFLDMAGKEVDRIVGRETPERMETAIAKAKKGSEPSVKKEVTPTPAKKSEDCPSLTCKEPTGMPTAKQGIIMLEKITDLDAVMAKKQPVMYDFFTTWCAPCKKLEPILEELAKEYNDVIIVKIDAEMFKSLASKYKIEAYPTLVFFNKDGKEVTRFTGYSDAIVIKGYFNQVSSKKGNIVIMSEEQMIAKMNAEKKMMPAQKTTTTAPATKTQDVKKTSTRSSKASRYRKK
ncbi:MAG: thioredoxin family protein [Candidatus Babeliales bacterium]